jgi:large subunit ribosomal protein L7/L12
MATKHEELLESIGNMTVLELSEFVEAFKEKFNVTAMAAPVAMPGAAAGGGAGPAGGEKGEFVDGAPNTVKESASKAEAEEMKSKLEEVGAAIALK